MIVSATILAAGSSSRMGEENKLLLPVNGIPMIRQVGLREWQAQFIWQYHLYQRMQTAI
jgi:CTP:molybdopterin cytidylyltransferase MocA